MGTLTDITGLDLTGDAAAFTGRAGADAALAGAKIQEDVSRDALELLRSDLAPFREGFGEADLQRLRLLATDPGAQAELLRDNPLFQSLKNKSREDIFRGQSASGRLGGSGTDQRLQSSFLSLGNDFINQQINRQLPLLNAAQASAAQAATGSSNLLTGIGNAQAAGGIGAQNALAQGQQNMATAATGLMALFSDRKLKDNIKQIGEYNGLGVYSWDWNEKANELGLKGSDFGHIADEVAEVRPDLVEMSDTGFLKMNYDSGYTVRAR